MNAESATEAAWTYELAMNADHTPENARRVSITSRVSVRRPLGVALIAESAGELPAFCG
jgi:hypothetical protein